MTPEWIDATIDELSANRAELQRRRDSLLHDLRAGAVADRLGRESSQSQDSLARLGEEWATLHAGRDRDLQAFANAQQRLDELRAYESGVKDELARLDRARAAGVILNDLRVTHCPACDQSVSQARGSMHTCYLCLQDLVTPGEQEGSAKRLDFELEQLHEEQREITPLLEQSASQLHVLQTAIRRSEDEIQRVESLLRPARAATASILPPELGILDQEAGRQDERIRQLSRIKEAFATRRNASVEVARIELTIRELEQEVDSLGQSIDFGERAEILGNEMNNYLNALNAGGTNRWPEGAVKAKLWERGFRLTVGGEEWSAKLGATLKCYFLAAYHFALLSLSKRDGFHYPGFAVLDFPPTLADGQEVADKENYIIEPFVALSTSQRLSGVQLIAAGRAFEGLEGANRIELGEVWK